MPRPSPNGPQARLVDEAVPAAPKVLSTSPFRSLGDARLG
jgi:hypothetical protein